MKRRFEVVTAYKKCAINIPVRQTRFSAGYDLEAARNYIIDPGEIVLVSTGLKAYFPKNEVLLIINRSSMSLKRNLMLPNGVGVIDKDYVDNSVNEGEIFVQLYNFSSSVQNITKGERIAQAIFSKFNLTSPDNVKNEKRKSGFGSSGK
ncbi:MAG: dUTP diphosphatase [Acholeplasmatales bacterium]|jgi:dUTP pyrophosphatase|nr:dUTP diphosphatase [Acholeplasmatales bacterium]